MSRTWHKKKASHRRGSKRFDKSCRSNGGCPWCAEGRSYRWKKRLQIEEKDYEL